MKIDLQPKNADTEVKIWRYMDLTKFLDLILNRAIYLRRIDKFEDPYEGYISEAYKSSLETRYISMQNEVKIDDTAKNSLYQTHLNGLKFLPIYTYASCWYLGDVESAAMWKLYGENNNCIAICSTVNDLKVTLEEIGVKDGTVHLRKVKYIDEMFEFDINNVLQPMFEKRLSFSHENEFRALYLLDKGIANFNQSASLLEPEKDYAKNKDGMTFDINVEKLIKKIYISPTASANFHSIVEKILKLSGFEGIDCIQSELYKLK